MQSRMARPLPWMGLLFLLSACAVLFPDRRAPKSSNYLITPPTAPWHKLPVGADPDSTEALKADLAYENPETGSIISLNSLCRKYHAGTLDSLTTNLVRGIGAREMLRRQETTLDGAPALDTLFSGEVDKVRLHIRTVVLIKDSCTYDFIHVSVPKNGAAGAQEFDAFLASFKSR